MKIICSLLIVVAFASLCGFYALLVWGKREMKWIPINKESPVFLKNVIVTVEHQHRWVSFAWLGSDKCWHYADNGERMPKEFKIIAWMQKPEPYTN